MKNLVILLTLLLSLNVFAAPKVPTDFTEVIQFLTVKNGATTMDIPGTGLISISNWYIGVTATYFTNSPTSKKANEYFTQLSEAVCTEKNIEKMN